MPRLTPALISGMMTIVMAACGPINTAPPPEFTSVSTSTPAPTATTVWFPPTATGTLLIVPTQALLPTEDIQLLYGSLVINDNFDNPETWTLGKVPDGSMALGLDELTLAVSRHRGQLVSLRQDTQFEDFYLEVTASPSICQEADEYGIMLRVSSLQEFFRFSLTCDGRARVDRYYRDIASSPHPPEYFGVIPPGAPSSSRLGVWVSGPEMRFYANGSYLFSIRDSTIPSGGLGLYARALSSNSMTVNFSEFKIYEALP
jgi:hypothetical protein